MGGSPFQAPSPLAGQGEKVRKAYENGHTQLTDPSALWPCALHHLPLSIPRTQTLRRCAKLPYAYAQRPYASGKRQSLDLNQAVRLHSQILKPNAITSATPMTLASQDSTRHSTLSLDKHIRTQDSQLPLPGQQFPKRPPAQTSFPSSRSHWTPYLIHHRRSRLNVS